MRPTHGVTFQGTYTWSRTLGISNGVGTTGDFHGQYRDLLDQRADYGLLPSHRLHNFRSYGTFQLHFGPGRLLGGASSGWIARLIEGWQFGGILTMTSGAPLIVAGRRTLHQLGTPNIVGAF